MGTGGTLNIVREGDLIAITLEDGESVGESLVRACEHASITDGMIVSGIGMVRDAEIGYWDGKKYNVDRYGDPSELLSMHGSIATEAGKPSLHIHVNLSGKDHNSFGGHLVGATVNNVNEIAILKFFSGSFRRELNERTGLPTLRIDHGGN